MAGASTVNSSPDTVVGPICKLKVVLANLYPLTDLKATETPSMYNSIDSPCTYPLNVILS